MIGKKPFARSKAAGSQPAANLALAKAYQRLFSGNGTIEDGEMVLTDLATEFDYYRRPRYVDWLARRQSPDGFELHSALCNARAEVVQRILDHVRLGEEDMLRLEAAARLER